MVGHEEQLVLRMLFRKYSTMDLPAALGCCTKRGFFRAIQLLYELMFLVVVSAALSGALGMLVVRCVRPLHID